MSNRRRHAGDISQRPQGSPTHHLSCAQAKNGCSESTSDEHKPQNVQGLLELEAREELQEDVPGPFEGNFDHQKAVLVDRCVDRPHATG